ncbi:uncharacterized protein F4807DRAFT_447421 [Annulohypoxylon truncatum]|uniref:uncharacterized protein n=1 Tax=Annulohypoxylon truncatum TaxID=327061 RepID=UPI0020088087|nr:uncharacterized protein F4807DRAFT_447421 [Annulohypoxylon truncatum]KAI1204364.1 hypothetical protein F4807DRAFT_447421 [Annulohypoxylon truncatum]
MAPGQNTFTIIPNAPGAINGDSDTSQSRSNIRPMTTKQAKKAYQKANKGPKLSKAEKRRQELFEQDRIRKEFEREKNQARAKAARDRKREKEEKERAEKKKKGLPLVDVHPSQDTIAWFVRGKSKKKHDNSVVSLPAVSKHDSDDCDGRNDRTSSSDENEPEPPPKRQRTESPAPAPAPAPVPMDADLGVDPDPDHSPSPAGVIGDSMSAAQTAQIAQGLDTAGETPQLPEVDDLVERCPTPDHPDIDIDEPETIESLPDELFNELIDATISSSRDEAGVPNTDLRRPSSREHESSNNKPSPKPSKDCIRSPTLVKDLPLEQKAEDSASLSPIQRPLQALSATKVNSRISNTPKEPTPDRGNLVNSPAQAPRRDQLSASISRSFHHPKTPMGPPPIPPKFKSRSPAPSRDLKTPTFLVKQTHTPKPKPNPHESYAYQKTREELPPTSTQLFMLGHLEDFFPSPSQEVRELFEEPKSAGIGIGSSASKTRTTYPTRSSPSNNRSTKSISNTSDLNRLPPITTNSKPKSHPIQDNAFSTDASSWLPAPTANVPSSGNYDAFDMPFFSTQDFVLSSQDMKDLENETTSPLRSKQKNHSLQSDNAASNPGRCLLNVTQFGVNTYSTTSISLSPKKNIKELGLISRTVSAGGNHQLASPCPPAGTVGCPKGSSPIRRNATSSNPRIEDGVKPLEKAGHEVLPTTHGHHRYKALDTLHIKNDAAQPRNSPKPFFASSGREAHYKYVIERSKTASWEGISTRQTVQAGLQRFQRSENERSDKILTERITGDKDGHVIDNCTPSSGSRPTDSTPRPKTQPKSQSQPRSINQLSGSAGNGIQSPKAEEVVEKRPRQNNSRSSYEEMLEMLKQKETQKQGQQAMSASQETDYGEAGLDDVLCEML